MHKRCLIFEAYPFFSGSQRITVNVCKILKKNGYTVSLLVVDDRFGNIKKNYEQHVDEIIYINANPVLLKYGDEDSWFKKSNFFKSVFLGLLPFYLRTLKLIRSSKYDFLYCCDPRGAVMMLAAAIFFKKTKVLHFHGKSRLPESLSKLLLKLFDSVLCVSEAVADSLPESNKKSVVYNGIDFSQYEKIDTSKVEEYIGQKTNGDRSVIRFLYVGAIRPHKGLHHIVRAIKSVICELNPSVPVALFISGDPKSAAEISFKEALSNYALENNISKHIHWLGWNDNVLGWMKSCDYLLFSSIKTENNEYEGFGSVIESSEGLPTVLVESSICDLFSIAADVTGVKEVITDNQNGIIYDASYSGLVKTIEEVVKNKHSFISFPKNESFKLETFEKRILEVLV
ncbi:glycosyltransferase [Mucilaginibacter sp. Mucisp86]|uniref:glycosyltransferase n=1 Tax=Mucilaginibacter sp. Mucisp86 TaxID=3243060 RepID=UPI0039B3E7DF